MSIIGATTAKIIKTIGMIMTALMMIMRIPVAMGIFLSVLAIMVLMTMEIFISAINTTTTIVINIVSCLCCEC